MSGPMNFQSIILTLQHFWAEQGCLIGQPYYSQVGAGTNNPATILRVLGPEPWNVAYVEPSVRPDDGRYGDNPNRMQMHYQFQVILKPDPGNPQELYLKSLEALGIDPRQHDIRFVEDNWESPALGAWGLGWEVWLDGQEITQFTYFQQAGGITLDPVSVEITYGLERIAMALQKVYNFRNIQWSPTRTDGDINLQGEREHSRYYFEIADVERNRKLYEIYEAEAENALANGLVLPALDYILKCSHTFNVLDTRGAVGVTERQALFGRMRDLTHRVSELYLEQRQHEEYPWLEENENRDPKIREQSSAADHGSRFSDHVSPFLLEIGTEELPPADLDSALAQLRDKLPGWLDELRLTHGEVRVLGTPRRIVVSVADLAPGQPDRTSLVKGPPAERAFDAAGQPTKAAEGFARGKGIPVTDLKVQDLDGGRYAVATVYEPGRPAGEVLSAALPGLVSAIKFDKSMRWNASGVAFSRPVRWFLCLLGEAVVPFEYAGLHSGRVTRGLRFQEPECFEIARPAEYFSTLAGQGVILDPAERAARIKEQVDRLTVEAGGQPVDDPALLAEVTNLVESPTGLLGNFDPDHLRLPAEVLVSVMKKHQRYFPVRQQANLRPHFIVIRNGDDRFLEMVQEGNEQVIRARFADANFFISEDLKSPLESYLPRLGTLTFQIKLGSMLDKTKRIERQVGEWIQRLGLTEAEAATTRRAAALCKADLATRMVVEMTSLQGSMGAFYARQSGETSDVAQAIFEHYLPRSTGDMAPRAKPGLLIGLADRLDTLSGLFAAGLAPTGTKDPFAQRRAALGLVQALAAWDLDFDLREGLSLAAAGLPIEATEKSQAACLDFITGRLRAWLLEGGARYDIVDAALGGQGFNPAGAVRAVKDLAAWVARDDWAATHQAYARCVRITRDQKERFAIDPARFSDPAEANLFEAVQTAENAPRKPGSVGDLLTAFLPVVPAINRFFEAVMVMAEDPAVRANRLGLLQRVAALSAGVADFSKLEGF